MGSDYNAYNHFRMVILIITASILLTYRNVSVLLLLGIYYVAANVRFDSATSGQVLMSIAVNNDYTINNGLHVKESYLPKTNQQFSLRVSGFVHCQVRKEYAV